VQPEGSSFDPDFLGPMDTEEPFDKNAPWSKRLWHWTGWRGKTLWDWQALLFIPVTVALIASVFTQWQSERQRDIENLRAERAMVEAYLENIGTSLLEEDLHKAGPNSAVRLLSRARTLVVLDSVNEDRKVRVLEFLSETKLIQFRSKGEQPVISLRFANLSEARLVKRSILSNTDLDRAELINTNLDKANLSNSNLHKAKLIDAKLSHANLSGANLSGATGVSCKQTRAAKSLDGATMPNGKKYRYWLKDKKVGCWTGREKVPLFTP
jgi:hypothetical protein